MDSTRRSFMNQAAVAAGGMVAALAPAAGLDAAQSAVPTLALTETRTMSKGAKLRALLKRPGLTVAAQVLTAEYAAIAQHVGLDCVYIGGSIMARTHFLYEDFNLVLPNEQVEIAGRIADGVSIPLIADADQGGETPLNTYRTVRAFCRAGVAGAHIEDTCNPKHIGGYGGNPQNRGALNRLLSPEEMTIRLEAAVEAREKENTDFVIIARTDAIFNQRSNSAIDPKAAEEQAIKRGIAYAKAGADVFMVQSMAVDQIDRIARAVPIPLCDDNADLKDVRKTQLKLYLALKTTDTLLGLFEVMMRDLKDRDDQDHKQLNIPRPTYQLSQFSDIKQYQKLGTRWVEARDKMCKYTGI